MLERVTADEVKGAMIAANIENVDHHDCGICGFMCRFIRTGDALYFDPGCHCTGGSPLELRPWQDAADWINMQSDPEWRAKIAEKFGLTKEQSK